VNTVGRKLKRLRKAQSDAVMPLIGPLLDAYEMLSFAALETEELAELFEQLDTIQSAMEDLEDDGKAE
jgi:hypothetical protein